MRHLLSRQAPGQATVEFALAILAFLAVALGVIDTSRAVFSLHGLSRAAESIAHQVAVQYASRGSGYSLTSQDAQPMIQAAHTASDVTFSTAEPDNTTLQSNYQQLDNGAVYICAVPSFAQAQMIQVTVVGSFTPASTLFVGGRTMSISEAAAALTYMGEESGFDYQNQCPSH